MHASNHDKLNWTFGLKHHLYLRFGLKKIKGHFDHAFMQHDNGETLNPANKRSHDQRTVRLTKIDTEELNDPLFTR